MRIVRTRTLAVRLIGCIIIELGADRRIVERPRTSAIFVVMSRLVIDRVVLVGAVTMLTVMLPLVMNEGSLVSARTLRHLFDGSLVPELTSLGLILNSLMI